MFRHHPLMPFLAAGTGIATFSVMDALMKSASIAAGVFSAMLLRSALGAVIMLPVWRLRARGGWPNRDALRLHVLRAAVCAGMATSFFYGLVRIPMAEGIALSFIAPLIALYLAAVMLGETIGRPAILASLLGFGGVLIIAAGRLGQGGMTAEAGKGIAAILLSAVLYAWNLVLQRQQAQLAEPAEIAFFQSFVIALILACLSPWLFHLPPQRALLDIAGGALLAVGSLMLLSWGYARAEAQALLPIEYTAFIWSALMGWWMFGEAVTVATLAGVVLIVVACWIAARGHTEQTAL
ncbi:MAG: DMT family transporter [Sphingomonadales bacterium]|nr:DMT family transporter [Sphingomonadales bacterium]